ncbi:MAG: hypothetical protein SFY68_15630 [Candidatus Sumerlaeia bacterium]|nr:hypothetical protein [Candidatus Sumerlaeia bacterium]
MKSKYRIVILAEDLVPQNILYRFAKKLVDNDLRKIRKLALPAGKGAGEQFVRENFASEVQYLRQKGENIILLVHIDADMLSVPERKSQLDEALQKSGMPERQKSEPIALVIPKRHTEAWLYWIEAQSEEVDESEDYKSKVRSPTPLQLNSLAQFLFNHTRPNSPPPTTTPDSLGLALHELMRLP